MSKKQPTLSIHEERLLANAMSLRTKLMEKMMDPRRDFNKECGYPENPSVQLYSQLFKRNPIANRVVTYEPDACWEEEPFVFEVEDEDVTTSWEQAYNDLDAQHNLSHYWHRVDVQSRIGHYGVLLIGINDGKSLDQPAAGLEETGERSTTRPTDVELLYLRPFPESLAVIDRLENDPTNPRFGQPVSYTLKFLDPGNGEAVSDSGDLGRDQKVHWTRCVHIADNRGASEVWGAPEQERVLNRLLDLEKLYGGSAEMFWRGAFPGYSFEMSPDVKTLSGLDSASIHEQMDRFQNKLSRYISVLGLQVKSLQPQVASPKDHLEVQLMAIAIAKGVPLRMFMGSEQAQLASGQDSKTANRRIRRRQTKYCTPLIIRATLDRFNALGILPDPTGDSGDELQSPDLPRGEQTPPTGRKAQKLDSSTGEKEDETSANYQVEWPELDSQTPEEKAKVAQLLVSALCQYVSAGADTVVPPTWLFTLFMDFDREEIEAMLEEATQRIAEADDSDDPLIQKQQREEERQDTIRKEEADVQKQTIIQKQKSIPRQ